MRNWIDVPDCRFPLESINHKYKAQLLRLDSGLGGYGVVICNKADGKMCATYNCVNLNDAVNELEKFNINN